MLYNTFSASTGGSLKFFPSMADIYDPSANSYALILNGTNFGLDAANYFGNGVKTNSDPMRIYYQMTCLGAGVWQASLAVSNKVSGRSWTYSKSPRYITNSVTDAFYCQQLAWNSTAGFVGVSDGAIFEYAPAMAVWNGNVDGMWDTTTANWKRSAPAVLYIDGYQVLFDDTASGSGAVWVTNNGTVAPYAVTVNNTNRNYTITGSGAITGPASLTKNGSGTLTLAGANTYTGNTTVNGGTLELAQSTIATNSTVTVAGGAVLKLDFAGTNQVGALVLNGVSQPNGVYGSSTPGGYLAGIGSLQVGPLPLANYSTNITFTVSGSGSTLDLSWPETHRGWYAQSNAVNLAVSADWHDVPGSQTQTNLVILIDPALTNVFTA